MNSWFGSHFNSVNNDYTQVYLLFNEWLIHSLVYWIIKQTLNEFLPLMASITNPIRQLYKPFNLILIFDQGKFISLLGTISQYLIDKRQSKSFNLTKFEQKYHRFDTRFDLKGPVLLSTEAFEHWSLAFELTEHN